MMLLDRVFRTSPVLSPPRKLAAIGAAMFALAIMSAAGAAETSHEVWLISTRRAPSSGSLQAAEQRIDYWRLGQQHRWVKMDGDAFFNDADPDVPTTFFVHGNRTTANMAVVDGSRVYRRMRAEADGRPFRLAIWSWPADRIPGRVRPDVQVKAARADVQSYYLAQCLRRMDRNAPVCLIGYSFGARTIAGALHILGGGRLAGRNLPQTAEPTPPAEPTRPTLRQAVLVGCASDTGWLLPGRRNGLALSQVDRMLITRNGRDRKLKRYSMLYRLGGPKALGYVGPAGCRLSEKIELIDVSRFVGRAHGWACYEPSPQLRGRLGRYMHLEPSETP
ncbi:MAG: hypothetical protein HQ567_01445 [Candidatus Nealsonbacteria bacterium]|nr:hypothetical protein [Candidatus Nealsonbacteria bacterium]